ncbi:hypothetical protein [Alicyclobacillus mali (ex Roth et al. 2021)]|uniref:hypothetical protein n=1 Tax=Alicyclobacillus mali (ex Roth et al. 2021) TaxID=1123961 RepID=UPI001A8D1783|nr:hypothetical protein [Alicyclobacillus mali (ex Roth et al. 2021)]MCL6489240.1 hypothetical protein [Alicyclobacillus mali (ex Roth et al. 2021)]
MSFQPERLRFMTAPVLGGLLILFSLFPWFSFNVVIMQLHLSAFQLGPLGILLTIFGCILILSALLRSVILRAWVSLVSGVASLLLCIISNPLVHQVAAAQLSDQLGVNPKASSGASSILDAITSPSYGFYFTLFDAIALTIWSIWLVRTASRSADGQMNWKDEPIIRMTSHLLSKSRKGPTPHAIRHRVRTIRFVRNRRIMYSLGAIVVIMIGYFVARSVYNTQHSLTRTVGRFIVAVQDGATDSVIHLSATSHPVPQPVWQQFVQYYENHMDDLKQFLSPLEEDTYANGSTLQSILDTSGSVQATPRNVLGFISYQIDIPVYSVHIAAPSGTKLELGHEPVSNTFYAPPAMYTVVASIPTPFGTCVQTAQVQPTQDETNVQVQGDTLTIQSPDIVGQANVIVNGKQAVVNMEPGWGVNTGTISPVPSLNGKHITLSIQEPWGTYQESGTVQGDQVQTQPIPDPNSTVFQALFKLVDEFNAAKAKAYSENNFQPVLKYLAPDGPLYQNDVQRSDLWTDQEIYKKMTASPTLTLVQLSNGQTGLQMNDIESYAGNYTGDSGAWTYTFEYQPNSKKWIIYNQQTDWTPISQGITVTH